MAHELKTNSNGSPSRASVSLTALIVMFVSVASYWCGTLLGHGDASNSSVLWEAQMGHVQGMSSTKDNALVSPVATKWTSRDVSAAQRKYNILLRASSMPMVTTAMMTWAHRNCTKRLQDASFYHVDFRNESRRTAPISLHSLTVVADAGATSVSPNAVEFEVRRVKAGCWVGDRCAGDMKETTTFAHAYLHGADSSVFSHSFKRTIEQVACAAGMDDGSALLVVREDVLISMRHIASYMDFAVGAPLATDAFAVYGPVVNALRHSEDPALLIMTGKALQLFCSAVRNSALSPSECPADGKSFLAVCLPSLGVSTISHRGIVAVDPRHHGSSVLSSLPTGIVSNILAIANLSPHLWPYYNFFLNSFENF